MERSDEIMLIQNRISGELNHAKKNLCMRVIIDRIENDFVIGRSEHDSPEIDQEVLIYKTETEFRPGSFAKVRIVDADDYDLFGIVE
jgi:ribosomal protein S12 methylthiotransferase